jgi:hypothetical protein
MNSELAARTLHHTTRRTLLGNAGFGFGSLALADLMKGTSFADSALSLPENPMMPRQAPLSAKAKSVIYLHLSGAPPALDMFDYKPKLVELNMQDCPESLFKGKRFAFIKGVPKMLGTPRKFARYGQNGTWVSDVLPHTAGIVDDITIVRSMVTDQFNHAPAELMVHTGNMRAGSASLGSWLTYGLGSENQDLPGFVVLLSGGTDPTGGKSLWGSGFLPSIYQGVQCRTSGEPILFSSDPAGMSRGSRRRSLDALAKLNAIEAAEFGDPETLTRIAQYELAYRMQAAVPEVFDIGKESRSTLDLYGAKPGEGSFANNCLLARRLVENGVRFVQLFDWGWDMHGTGKDNDLLDGLPNKGRDVDQACAALVKDLKQRGMLEDTLVICGGEFGRTPMNEARGGSKFLGRDHHPNCFTMWFAGGGMKAGYEHGATDELGYDVVEGKVTVRDLQSTVLHLMGFDPYKLNFRYQGLNQRLIGPTNEGKVIKELLA